MVTRQIGEYAQIHRQSVEPALIQGMTRCLKRDNTHTSISPVAELAVQGEAIRCGITGFDSSLIEPCPQSANGTHLVTSVPQHLRRQINHRRFAIGTSYSD